MKNSPFKQKNNILEKITKKLYFGKIFYNYKTYNKNIFSIFSIKINKSQIIKKVLLRKIDSSNYLKKIIF